MILYLHGFRSSPLSFKARLVGERLRALELADRYRCPQLPASPREAAALIRETAGSVDPGTLSVIGSSLGGFYATWLAEQTGCRAVLLNPAVAAPRDLARHVGATTDYHTGARFEFRAGYLDELDALRVAHVTRPERYFLIAATGDEVLDWREMTAHYPGARQCVIEGSDHGLSDFPAYLNQVLAFCGAGAADGA